MKILAAASIVALSLSLADALYSKAKHSEIMADILSAAVPHAEAATYDPCFASDPYGVGDPTPDDPAACEAWFDSRDQGNTVAVEIPRGFPCNPEFGGACPDTYIYHAKPARILSIWQNAMRYILNFK